MDVIKPVVNEPALIIEQSSNKRILVIADLHLGIEHTLIKKGVQIPPQIQTDRLINKLKEILKQVQPVSLIILGDIKHSVPVISAMEWQEVPVFFEPFTSLPIHIILGNHESGSQIEGLTTRNITIHHAQGCLLSLEKNGISLKVALFHGHTWPAKDLFNADVVIMAHNHPAIEFRSEFNVRSTEPVWIRAHWDQLKLATAYLKYRNVKKSKNPLKVLQEKFQMVINAHSQIIIMPAFNDLIGGIPFNTRDSKFIGPLLKSKSLNIDEAEAILLDGTILGKIQEIRL